ncbi:hypothetical protein JQ632_25445 [Bradyrhizobium liaoningense]|nr:hypothetical protein [Bradyrhizobium liaoningense]
MLFVDASIAARRHFNVEVDIRGGRKNFFDNCKVFPLLDDCVKTPQWLTLRSMWIARCTAKVARTEPRGILATAQFFTSPKTGAVANCGEIQGPNEPRECASAGNTLASPKLRRKRFATVGCPNRLISRQTRQHYGPASSRRTPVIGY